MHAVVRFLDMKQGIVVNVACECEGSSACIAHWTEEINEWF